MEGKLICHGIRCSRISARLLRHCLPTIHDLLCIGHLHVTYKDELIRCGPRRSVESIVLRTNEYRAEILLGWSDKRETCLDICLARANETSYVFSSFSARCINKQNEQQKVETIPGSSSWDAGMGLCLCSSSRLGLGIGPPGTLWACRGGGGPAACFAASGSRWSARTCCCQGPSLTDVSPVRRSDCPVTGVLSP